jgi:uncharacterized membrane protein
MKVRLYDLWEALRTSFWFVPALMTAAAIALYNGLSTFDASLDKERVEEIGALWRGDADGAKQLLAMIAQSIITVAGVVFSITIVWWKLACPQILILERSNDNLF